MRQKSGRYKAYIVPKQGGILKQLNYSFPEIITWLNCFKKKIEHQKDVEHQKPTNNRISMIKPVVEGVSSVGQHLTSMYKVLGSSPQIKYTATKKSKLGESMSEGLSFYSLTKLSWNPFFNSIVPKTRLVYLTHQNLYSADFPHYLTGNLRQMKSINNGFF